MQKACFINFKIRGFHDNQKNCNFHKAASQEDKPQLILKPLAGYDNTAGEEEGDPEVELVREVDELPGPFRKESGKQVNMEKIGRSGTKPQEKGKFKKLPKHKVDLFVESLELFQDEINRGEQAE